MTKLEKALHDHMVSILSKRYVEPISDIIRNGNWYVTVPPDMIRALQGSIKPIEGNFNRYRFGALILKIKRVDKSGLSNLFDNH